jgi:hypothetical protein
LGSLSDEMRPLVRFAPTQYFPSVTPPTSECSTYVQTSVVSDSSPKRLPRACEVATIDRSRQKEHFCLTNDGPPEIKTRSKFECSSLSIDVVIDKPGTVPAKQRLMNSWPFSRARIDVIPKEGRTSNQTGQSSEMTPTRRPFNRLGLKKPLALVPSLFRPTCSGGGAANAGALSVSSPLIRPPLPQEGLIFLLPCPWPSLLPLGRPWPWIRRLSTSSQASSLQHSASGKLET